MTDRDRLIELLRNSDNDKNLGWYDLYDLCRGKGCAEYFADYLLANGVIVPPCKAGDTVYYVSFGKIYKGECHAITQHRDSLQIHLYDFDGDNASISAKTVFLTKEEAEKKLEELRGNVAKG